MHEDQIRELRRALAAARSALEAIQYETRGEATRDEAMAHNLATKALEDSKTAAWS